MFTQMINIKIAKIANLTIYKLTDPQHSVKMIERCRE